MLGYNETSFTLTKHLESQIVLLYKKTHRKRKTRDRIDIPLIDTCQWPYESFIYRKFQKASRRMGPSSGLEKKKTSMIRKSQSRRAFWL